MSAIREDAGKIRAALEAVERADDAGAMAQLRGIPRQSLFADWKLFVRGLMAYYRHDTSDMLANWDRLDKNRPAAKITEPLKVMAGVTSIRQNAHLLPKIKQLEGPATGQSVLGILANLQQPTMEHDWHGAVRTLKRSGSAWRKLDAGTYRRVVLWLCGELIDGEHVQELDQLARFAEPPAIDPHWHRARAAVRESAGDGNSRRYWQKYLQELECVTALSPADRKTARGLVHLHLAKDYVHDAECFRRCTCGWDHSEELEAAESIAIEHFNQCLELAPTYQPAYVSLAEFHTSRAQPHETAKIHERWLERMPNDPNVLCLLSTYHRDYNSPQKAREFAERAHHLKPLDKAIGDLLWETHVGSARLAARRCQFDQARDDLAAADRLRPDRKDDYDVLARQAVLEIKAGIPKAARRFIEQAQETLAEPTALWLVMTVEATQMELPNKEAWLYEKRWRTSLKRRCRSDTAGLLCRTLMPHLQASEPYENCDEHVKALLRYVRRCSRVKWHIEDLRSVCEFVDVAQEYRILNKLVKRGLRNFPQAAYPHWFAARLEIAKGPIEYDSRSALLHLQNTTRLASASSDPRDREVLDSAKQAETMLSDIAMHRSYMADEDEQEDFEPDFSNPFDGLAASLAALPRDIILEVIGEICQEKGLDPEQVIRTIDRHRDATTRAAK